MSQNLSKILLAMLVIVIIVFGGWFLWKKYLPNKSPVNVVITSSPTPTTTQQVTKTQPEPSRIADNNIKVESYDESKVYSGLTYFTDLHDIQNPRIVAINHKGEVVWEYNWPEELKKYTQPGSDLEILDNGNILFMAPQKGVYELDKNSKQIIWQYEDSKISHDVDRLANGNTLVVFGAEDKATDYQVKEIDKNGSIVWKWSVKEDSEFDNEKYQKLNCQGFTHTNGAQRLDNGNTIVSLRNFNLLAEIDANGKLIKKHGEGKLYYTHDPELLSDGNILVASQPPLENCDTPKEKPDTSITLYSASEINLNSDELIWKYANDIFGSVDIKEVARGVQRLPNGNTLITGTSKIVEITKDGKTVWLVSISNGKDSKDNKSVYKSVRK